MCKFHCFPCYLQLLQHLFHCHFFTSFVYNIVNLILKVVQIQAQQISQIGFITHDELYSCCLDQLLPMSISNCRILKLTHCSQRGQHILDSQFQPCESIPLSHFLVKSPNIFPKLLTFHIHVLNINVCPKSCFPFINACPDQKDIIPELFQHLVLSPTFFNEGEFRYCNLKEASLRLQLLDPTLKFLNQLECLSQMFIGRFACIIIKSHLSKLGSEYFLISLILLNPLFHFPNLHSL